MAASSKANSIPVKTEEPTEPVPVVQEKTLFTWRAPARFFKKRTKEFWTKIGLVSALFGTILFISEGVMPVLLLIAVLFLFYILSTVEPEEIEYKITNLGFYTGKDKINYFEIIRFWFANEADKTTLYFDLTRIPGTINILLNAGDLEKVRAALIKYVPEETPEFSNTEKASKWLTRKLQ